MGVDAIAAVSLSRPRAPYNGAEQFVIFLRMNVIFHRLPRERAAGTMRLDVIADGVNVEAAQGEVLLGKLTSAEFKSRLGEGGLHAAIIALGATEQHLEHLAMEHDIAMAQYIATEAAKRVYPAAVVVVPTTLGLSEHHMAHAGTLTAKPGGWHAIVFDAVDSLARAGLTNILLLNGHAGNETPMDGALRQWQMYFRNTAPEVNVQFESYWNLCREFSEAHCEGAVPGHAQEYETAMALYALPDNVRRAALDSGSDPSARLAMPEQGRELVEQAISGTVRFLSEMSAGTRRAMMPLVSTRERYERLRRRNEGGRESAPEP